MKQLILLALTAFFLPLSSQQNEPAWRATAGPYGGDINVLFKSSRGQLFAGTSSGLYISLNEGLTWSSAGENVEVTCITESNGKLYIGTGGKGIYTADPEGNNWKSYNEGLSTFYRFCGYCIHGLYTWNNKIVAATGDGLFTRTPNDTAWSFALSGFHDKVDCQGSIVVSTEVTRYGPGASTYWRDLSDLSSKSIQFPGTDSNDYRNLAQSLDLTSSGLYAISGNALYLSKDEGNNWQQLYSDTGLNAPVKVQVIDNRIYLSTRSRLLVSENGSGFTAVGLNEPVNSLLKSGNGIMAGCLANKGIYKNVNQDWNVANEGLTALNILAIRSNKNLVAAAFKGGVALSTDTGSTWKKVHITENVNGVTQRYDDLSIDQIDLNDKYILLASSNFPRMVFASADQGQTWTSMKQSVESLISGVTITGNRLYVQTWFENYYSDDAGQTWQKEQGDGSSFWWDFASSQQQMYRLDFDIFSSTDGGNNWKQIHKPIQNNYRGGQLHVNDSLLFYINAAEGLYVGRRDGSDWLHSYKNNIDYYFASFELGTSNTDIFLNDRFNKKTVHSFDGGRSWQPVTGIKTDNLQQLGSGSYYAYAAIGAKGVWRYGKAGKPEPQNAVINNDGDFEIYPNPASSRFKIRSSEKTVSDLYDSNGQLIIAGYEGKDFDVSHLRSGIYFLKIKSGDRVITRKLIIR